MVFSIDTVLAFHGCIYTVQLVMYTTVYDIDCSLVSESVHVMEAMSMCR